MQKFDKSRHFFAAKGALRSKFPVTTSPETRLSHQRMPGALPEDHSRVVLVDHQTYGVRLASGKVIRRVLSVHTCAITGVVLRYTFEASLDAPATTDDFFDLILIDSRPSSQPRARRKSPR